MRNYFTPPLKRFNYLSTILLMLALSGVLYACRKEILPESIKTGVAKTGLTKVSQQAEGKIVPFNRIPFEKTLNARITIKTKDTINRRPGTLPAEVLAKLKERLNRSPNPKSPNKSNQGISVSTVSTGSSTFSATNAGSNTWDCEAYLDGMPGYNYGIEWYIMDDRTGGYMALAVTNTTTLNFQVTSPDYGYYHIFGYESVNATLSQTNELLLGDPASGTYRVSLITTAYWNLLITRHSSI